MTLTENLKLMLNFTLRYLFQLLTGSTNKKTIIYSKEQFPFLQIQKKRELITLEKYFQSKSIF
jgi:hypothetical protein